jgi:general secretion pathway protein M
MKQWWEGLQARERRTLMLGALALGIMFFYFGIWQPTHTRAAALEQQVADQRVLLAWMQQASAEARALQGSAPARSAAGTSGQGLFALADQSARQAGLGNAIRRVEPSGNNRVRVNLEQASFDDMVRWLATLKSRHGIEIDTLSVRAGNEPGRVNAQLLLEAPAS